MAHPEGPYTYQLGTTAPTLTTPIFTAQQLADLATNPGYLP